ncbi:MAG: coproporphyrinogen III oxidase [Rhodobacteraceae bacterium]|nr:coproporphyrinogen III oxidase [Paracoccaceae bacterium]|tara:strand:+ start:957 stop:2096 length:1140 start_codon:yes stop_codon:yes gene_type:complete
MSGSSIAIYIHWPFCKIKCPYCDFNSYRREAVNQSYWVKAYIKALEFWFSKLKNRKISSIFFGGGTPSLLNTDFVELVLEKIDELWGINSNCEITIEANPNSVSNDKFKRLKIAGINRVSVGVQALIDQDLIHLGRDHDKNQAIEAINIVKKWFKNYNLDFIYGRQCQSIKEWFNELSHIISLEAPHLSLYQLTIEENTNFYKLFKKDLLEGMPSEKIVSEMYDVTRKLCEDGGYRQYETSNFSRKGFKCKHNLSYWKYNDYIGIGPGAHGRIRISGKKYATEEERNPDIWFKETVSSKSSTPKITPIDTRVMFEEELIMNLRISKNIPISIFDLEKIRPVVADLEENKLIKLKDNEIIMKKRGTKMLDYISRSLIDCY